MAILVKNSSGAYTSPRKLWYLVNGKWVQIKKVYESPVQEEMVVADRNRILLDKTANGLNTKITEINKILENPTTPAQTLLDKTEELSVLKDQLNIVKVEQVVQTKTLFEQKAQYEFKQLVSTGEAAFKKITTLLKTGGNWGVIKIAPLAITNERTTTVILHGLNTNERTFNYGTFSYRLYKKEEILDIDNTVLLKNAFHKRLSPNTFSAGTEATNYTVEMLTIEQTLAEIGKYISSGTNRIKDFLANIAIQNQFILDKVEVVKTSYNNLLSKANEGSINVSIDTNGSIISNNTLSAFKTTLGSTLIKSQNVSSVTDLISNVQITQIKNGELDQANFPSYTKVVESTTAIDSKITTLSNIDSQTSLTVESITNTESTLTTEEIVDLIDNGPKTDSGVTGSVGETPADGTTIPVGNIADNVNSFWDTPLGDSTIANKGNDIFITTFSSNGIHVFTKSLVETSSTPVYIISSQALTAQDVLPNLDFETNARVYIINILNHTITPLEAFIEFGQPETKNIINVMDSIPNLFETQVQQNTEGSNYIISNVESVVGTPTSNLILEANHPDITAIFTTKIYKFDPTTNVSVYEPSYELFANIRLLAEESQSAIEYNPFVVNTEKYSNIINLAEESQSAIEYNPFIVNTEKYSNIVNLAEESQSAIEYNPFIVNTEKYSNIVNLVEESQSTIEYNPFVTNNTDIIILGQEVNYTTTDNFNGILIYDINSNDITLEASVYESIPNIYNLIINQTGVMVADNFEDHINKMVIPIPIITTVTDTKPFSYDSETLSRLNTSPVVTTMVNINSVSIPIETMNVDPNSLLGSVMLQKVNLINNLNDKTYLIEDINNVLNVSYQLNKETVF